LLWTTRASFIAKRAGIKKFGTTAKNSAMKTILLAILTLGLLIAPASRLDAVCTAPPVNPGGEGSTNPAPTPSPTPAKPGK